MTSESAKGHPMRYLLVSCFLGVGAVVVGKFIPFQESISRSIRLPGKVVSLRRVKGGEGGYCWSPDVEFKNMAGEMVIFQSGSNASWKHWSIGQKVTVLVDPENPLKPDIDERRSVYFVFGLMILVIIFLIYKTVTDDSFGGGV
jgi:Protein of unknown function (DUF3592)